MNILFFLRPKSEVAYIYDYHTLRQALEIMEYHKYSSVPMTCLSHARKWRQSTTSTCPVNFSHNGKGCA